MSLKGNNPMMEMNDALAVVLSSVRVLTAEERTLLDGRGYVLAEDIVATEDVPPFDNSAMDGYAVRYTDIAHATPEYPTQLQVLADLPAGQVAEKVVGPAQAMRIMTGAPIPAGTDTVVMKEKTTSMYGKVNIFTSGKPGDNIRRRGEDIPAGLVVLHQGAKLRPAEIGILAAIGKGKVRVVHKPRVGVLATGDELVPPDQPMAPGKIRNSNSYSLQALIQHCGGLARDLGVVRDTPAEISNVICHGLKGLDMLLLSGGISVGDYDCVAEVLSSLEAEIKFHQVAIKPGKPMAFVLIGGTPVFALPGNPASAMICFELFVRPVLLKMQGFKSWDRMELLATLEEDIAGSPDRVCILRGKVAKSDSGYRVRLSGPQGSAILSSMCNANCLIIVPADVPRLTKGERIPVQLLDVPELDQ